MPKRPLRAHSPAQYPVKRPNDCFQLHNPFDVLAVDDEYGSCPDIELAPAAPMHYAPSNNICFSPNIFVAPEQTVKSPAALDKPNEQKSKVSEAPKPRRSSRRRVKKDSKAERIKSRPLVPVVEIVSVKGQITNRPKSKVESVEPENIAKDEKSLGVKADKDHSSNTPAIDALRAELDALKSRCHENEFLCLFRNEEVSNKAKEIIADTMLQKGHDAEITRLIETLEGTIKINEERGHAMDQVIKVVGEVCDRQKRFGETMRRIEGLEEQLANMIQGAEQKVSAKELDEVVESIRLLEGRISQLGFRVNVVADANASLNRSVDHTSRIAGLSKGVPVTTSNEALPREVIAAAARHWVLHMLGAAKSVLGDTCSLRTCENLVDTVHNTPSASSAIAVVLRIILEMIVYVANDAFDHEPDPASGPRAALRLYTALYPVIRKALVHLARLPGPWCRQEQDRCLATSQLKESLELILRRANLGEVHITNGDPFSGLSQTPRDRWLPAIKHDEDPNNSTYVLLSTPPIEVLDDLDVLACRTPIVTSWQNFFARKYPSLRLDITPLFVDPLFPSVWSDNFDQISSVSRNLEQKPLMGMDAVNYLISWIGRALIVSSEHEHEDASQQCAIFSLSTYPDLRCDLCNAIDVATNKELAHGSVDLPKLLMPAGRFIGGILYRLVASTGVEDSYDVIENDDNAFTKIGADYWLPRVRVNAPMHARSSKPPSPCFVDLTAEESDFEDAV